MQLLNTKEELYKLVTPALNVKLSELEKLNYFNINKEDIWNYLIRKKWSKSIDLTLADVVSDIIHLDNKELYNYILENK